MEINGIKSFDGNNINGNNTAARNSKAVTAGQKESALISNPLKEILGRCQVNFSGKTAEKALTKEDKAMIDMIGKIYKVNTEDVDFIQKYTADYLKEKGVKNLSELYSEDPIEYKNKIAGYCETIIKKLGLGDIEGMDLDLLITTHICSGDICSDPDAYKSFRYTRDTVPFLELTKNLDIDILVGYMMFDKFKDLANKYDYDSIFDIFSKENLDDRKAQVQEILGEFFKEDSTDAVNNIMFELYNLAGKTHEERITGINPNELTESTRDWMNTLAIAGDISEMYNLDISEELLELINSRKTNTQVHKDGKPLQEVAFQIADKYQLPQGAEKQIIHIIQTNDNNPFDEEKMNKLIQTMIAEI